MLEFREILFAVGVPAAWTAIVLLAAWRPWPGGGPLAGGYWGGPIALAGCVVSAFFGANNRLPQFPPNDVTDWLPYIAVAAAGIGLADATLQIPRGIRWTIGCACIAAATWLLLRPLPAETHSLSTKLGWLVMRTVIWSGWWIALDGYAQDCRGVSVPRDLLIVTGASGLVLIMSASKLLGLLGGSLAVSLVVFVLLGLFANSSMARGGVLVFATLHSGLLLCGLFYAQLTRGNAVLLLLGALLATAGRFWPVNNLSGWKRHLVQVALVSVPAGVAVALAAADFTASMSDSSIDYGY